MRGIAWAAIYLLCLAYPAFGIAVAFALCVGIVLAVGQQSNGG